MQRLDQTRGALSPWPQHFSSASRCSCCLRVPIAMAIGGAVLVTLIWGGYGDGLYIVPQQVLEGVDNASLVAVPFFILTGNLMNVSGMTDKIFNFAMTLVGHMKAGLAQVNVLASMIFAGVNGTAVGDIAGLGQLEVKAMRERGYPADFAAALTVASSVVGPIIPPSVGLVVYAFLSNTSVARLFLGGIIPGILVGISLMIFNRVYAVRFNIPTQPRASFVEIARSGRRWYCGPCRARHHNGRHHHGIYHRDGSWRARLRLCPGRRPHLSAAHMEACMEGADGHHADDHRRHDHRRLLNSDGVAAGHRAGAAEAGSCHALVDGLQAGFPCPADCFLPHHRMFRRRRAGQADPGAGAAADYRRLWRRPGAFRPDHPARACSLASPRRRWASGSTWSRRWRACRSRR